jgi:PAS domain S-box-containing protein
MPVDPAPAPPPADVASPDRATVITWITDPDGACVYLSEGWYEVTGQTPETALGFGWLDASHPDDRASTTAVFARANERREPFRLEYRLRGRDGEYRWAIDAAAPRFAPDGTFLGFVGTVIDITDRRRTEEALRESEARFRALFHAIDEGFCLAEMVLDAEGRPVDYRFLEANPLFETMTGLHDAIGRTAYELVPDLEPKWVETYAQVALGGRPVRFESGSEAMGRVFDVFATPVEPRGRFALVFTDVTERRRAEQLVRDRESIQRRARRQAEVLAEVVSALEAVDGFDAGVRLLAAALVPRIADFATIERPGEAEPIVALAHRDPRLEPVLRGLRERGRLAPNAGDVVARAAAGQEQLVTTITPELLDPSRGAPDTAALLDALAPRSLMAVPLELGPDVRGALVLGLSDPARRPYAARDLAFVRRLADRTSVVFARARRREEEHQIALRLQQALLPDGVVHRPEVDVAARYEAASGVLEVGGDWYDTFALADGRVGVAVGDVVGHGLEAAAAMGRLRTALAALAPRADGPGELLSFLDEFSAGPNGAEFATACCATLDPATGELRYASAGHPPMLVAPPGGGPPRRLEEGRSGPLYGRPAGERAEAATVLEPGAALVLYSDGLVERRGEPITVGLERLEAALAAAGDAGAEALCDRLVEELGVARAREDDVVVLALRRRA